MPLILNTDTLDGFTLNGESSEQIANFISNFRNVTSTLANNISAEYYQNTGGITSIAGRETLLTKYFWLKLAQACDGTLTVNNQTPKIFITGKKLNFGSTQEPIETIKDFIGFDETGNVNAPNALALRIIVITRGMYVFDKMDADTDLATCRLRNLETPLIQNSFHRVRLYRNAEDGIVLVTNKYDPEATLYRMLGMLGMFYPAVRRAVEDKPQATELLKILFNLESDEIYAMLKKSVEAGNNERKLLILNRFKEKLSAVQDNKERIVLQQVQQAQDRVNEYYRCVTTAEEALRDKQLLLLTLRISKEDSIDQSAIEFLKNSNVIELTQCDNIFADFTITTPLTNYNIKDVKMWYRRNEPNVVTANPVIKKLFYETFVEGKYLCVLKTNIRVPLQPANTWQSSGDTHISSGNPHITRYQCYGQAQIHIRKLLSENKILEALNALIACCASITFTDSTVIRYFVDRLCSTAYEQKLFYDPETEEHFSVRDFSENKMMEDNDNEDA